ncbi:hypothetical protein TNCV_605101 [Trichonephila clavipes]|nr:hypothetical protein TNCV_605101 [Trichonephila clavipes]
MVAAPILPIPNIGVAAVHTCFMWSCIVVQDYCTVHNIWTFILNATPYMSPGSTCSTVRSLFCYEKQSSKQPVQSGIPDIICNNDHQLDWGRIMNSLLPPW